MLLLNKVLSYTWKSKFVGTILLLCFFSACGEDSVDHLINKGKDNLIRGDSSEAMHFFNKALKKDKENYQAAYGKMLSMFMEMNEHLDYALQLTKGMMVTKKDYPDTNLSIIPMQVMVDGIVNGIIVPKADVVLELASMLQQQKGEAFYLKNYQISILGKKLFDAGGEFDNGEVYLFEGLSHLLKGIGYLLLAMDSDFNADLLDFQVPENPDISDILRAVKRNLLTLLSDPDYPNFLKLRDSDGIKGSEMLKSSKTELIAMTKSLLNMISEVKSETDPQLDPPHSDPRDFEDPKDANPNDIDRTDIIRYVDNYPPNNKFDLNEYFASPRIKPISPVGIAILLEDLQKAFSNNEDLDIASLGRFLSDVLHLSYVIYIPYGCIGIPINGMFEADANGMRCDLANMVGYSDKNCPAPEDPAAGVPIDNMILMSNKIPEILEAFIVTLSNDAKYQLLWIKLANTFMEVETNNIEEKIDTAVTILEKMNSLGEIVLNEENMQKLVLLLEAAKDLDGVLLKDFVVVLNLAGELMYLIMDMTDYIPIPIATMTIDDIKNLYQRYAEELHTILDPLLYHLVPVLHGYEETIVKLMQKQEADEELTAQVQCLLAGIKISSL